MGQTLELVPLIVKVAALHHLMTAAQSMRQVVLSRKVLYGTVIGINVLVAIFCAVVTVVDTPYREYGYELTADTTEDGAATIVTSFSYCTSE